MPPERAGANRDDPLPHGYLAEAGGQVALGLIVRSVGQEDRTAVRRQTEHDDLAARKRQTQRRRAEGAGGLGDRPGAGQQRFESGKGGRVGQTGFLRAAAVQRGRAQAGQTGRVDCAIMQALAQQATGAGEQLIRPIQPIGSVRKRLDQRAVGEGGQFARAVTQREARVAL